MGLDILRAVQRLSHPVLDGILGLSTMLGDKIILAGVFCVIYWCFSKRMGQYLMFALCASTCLNGVVKDFFKMARPIGEEGIVSRFVKGATGHSFPSGHAQSAATFWWGAALWLRRGWLKAAVVLLILAVAFSRLYFGVHYPLDVIVGMLLGFLVSTLFYWWMKSPSGFRLTVLICTVLAAGCFLAGESEDTIAAGVMTLCVFAGTAFEAKLVRFQDGHGLWNRILRLLVGGAVAGVFYLLPKILLEGLWADALSVGLVAFVAMGLCPWLFTRLKWCR